MGKRQCIKCHQGLEPRVILDVEVDICPGCGGLWLDDGEVRQLAGDRVEQEAGRDSPRRRQRGDAAGHADPPVALLADAPPLDPEGRAVAVGFRAFPSVESGESR
mgnify:CR=1 FL=1